MIPAFYVKYGCVAPLTASPPAPIVPRISDLRLRPERVTAGCPVTIGFHFEDADRDVVRVVAHLSDEPSRARRVVHPPVDPADLAGKSSGDVTGVLTLGHYGRHRLHLRVEDAFGHRSNVLREILIVEAPLPWKAKRCS